MINKSSIDKVDAAKFSNHFYRPLYNSYCFSRIPATVEHLLTQKRLPTLPKDCFYLEESEFDMVIVFFIDGFGWTFFEKNKDRYPFLKRFVQEGVVSKITSQFPSTTAAHVTTINTGQEVGKTGVYEWFYYEPLVDRVVAPLLFSIAGEKVLGNLEKKGVTPKDIFPKSNFYMKLKKQNIDSFLVQPENIVSSPYSRYTGAGSHPISYYSFSQGLQTVVEAVNVPSSKKAYFLVYFPDIDSIGHRHGVESKEFQDAVDNCMKDLEESFMNKISKSNKKVAVIMTADHGMVQIDPKTTRFINLDVPEIKDFLKTNAKGVVLAPAGSCRDLFLHVKKEHLMQVYERLQKEYKDIAECYFVKDLIDQGFFGSRHVSEQFLQRVGDLVILPYKGQSVWWFEKGKFEQNFYASHGGITKEELHSLFLFNSI